jgi:hypothetical protein
MQKDSYRRLLPEQGEHALQLRAVVRVHQSEHVVPVAAREERVESEQEESVKGARAT